MKEGKNSIFLQELFQSCFSLSEYNEKYSKHHQLLTKPPDNIILIYSESRALKLVEKSYCIPFFSD